MIAIDNVLISDEVIEKNFVCHLEKCKGGCCVDGDCGAPLTEEEAALLVEIYPKIKKYIPAEGIKAIEEQGFYTQDDEHGLVTPTINNAICAYGYTDELGVVKCGIEQAYYDGIVEFKKPISCHLYPIRLEKTDTYEVMNYEPRQTLCKPACKLGNKLGVPVYSFLKEPLIRKYGEAFYTALDQIAKEHFDRND